MGQETREVKQTDSKINVQRVEPVRLSREDVTYLLGQENISYVQSHADQPELHTLLNELIPSEHNHFCICGKPVTNSVTKLIRSRIEAPTVSLEEHPYHTSPESFKEFLNSQSARIIAMTDRCTPACSFCGNPDKGPISKKMSVSFIRTLLEEKNPFNQDLNIPLKSGDDRLTKDNYYAITDPFDWQDRVFDYVSIMQLALDNQRCLYTSTAVPIGTEITVIRAIEFLLDNEVPWVFRLSRGSENAKRVDSILEFLHTKYGKKFQDLINCGYLTNEDRTTFYDNGRVLAGQIRKGIEPDFESLLLAPSCYDGVIIGVDKVINTFVTLHSETDPLGASYLPLNPTLEDNIVIPVPRFINEMYIDQEGNLPKGFIFNPHSGEYIVTDIGFDDPDPNFRRVAKCRYISFALGAIVRKLIAIQQNTFQDYDTDPTEAVSMEKLQELFNDSELRKDVVLNCVLDLLKELYPQDETNVVIPPIVQKFIDKQFTEEELIKKFLKFFMFVGNNT
ncbi:hypothetical protein JW796_01090 [Candidatus Dojkabacteria bacterium]|nr:hypothetical protein [Candidatus Dojkabacteria bacterium]